MWDNEWAFEVSRRLSLSIDLVASNAAYHKQCKTYFLCDKQLPGTKRDSPTQGQIVLKDKQDAFSKLCNSPGDQTAVPRHWVTLKTLLYHWLVRYLQCETVEKTFTRTIQRAHLLYWPFKKNKHCMFWRHG